MYIRGCVRKKAMDNLFKRERYRTRTPHLIKRVKINTTMYTHARTRTL